MSDDKIEEIGARHELVGGSGSVIRPTGFSWTIPGWVAHNDRAFLLAEVERLRAQIVCLEATGAEASDEIDRLRAALEAKP